MTLHDVLALRTLVNNQNARVDFDTTKDTFLQSGRLWLTWFKPHIWGRSTGECAHILPPMSRCKVFVIRCTHDVAIRLIYEDVCKWMNVTVVENVWSAVAQEYRALDWNPAVLNRGVVFPPSSLNCMNEYLTVVDIWTNSFRALIAAWLDASRRNWNGVWLNREVKYYKLWAVLYKNLPFHISFVSGVW